MRIGRIRTSAGPRVARISEDGGRALPPGDARPPGVHDPPLSEPRDLGEGDLLAPLQPRKICCIGRNYAAHAEELGNSQPARPLLFHKPASAVIGPGQSILLPPDSSRVEHEAELGIVIGVGCRHVDPVAAEAVIAGFVCVNDVTARDLQRADGQFARGKGFDTFCPIGPWLQTDLDWRDIELRCEVDGVSRQRGRTSQMIFDVPTLVATLSRIMTLQPGDVIASGTPAGVGPLVDGVVVTVQIEGIGALRNPVLADQAVPRREPPISQAR